MTFEEYLSSNQPEKQRNAMHVSWEFIEDLMRKSWVVGQSQLIITLPSEDEHGKITRTSAIRAIEKVGGHVK